MCRWREMALKLLKRLNGYISASARAGNDNMALDFRSVIWLRAAMTGILEI